MTDFYNTNILGAPNIIFVLFSFTISYSPKLAKESEYEIVYDLPRAR